MATVLIDIRYDGYNNPTTHNPLYDVLILPEADGIATGGQVISANAEAAENVVNPGAIPTMANFSISVKGSDSASTGTLSIGGNYDSNEEDPEEYSIRSGNEFNENYEFEVDNRYNVHHVQRVIFIPGQTTPLKPEKEEGGGGGGGEGGEGGGEEGGEEGEGGEPQLFTLATVANSEIATRLPADGEEGEDAEGEGGESGEGEGGGEGGEVIDPSAGKAESDWYDYEALVRKYASPTNYITNASNPRSGAISFTGTSNRLVLTAQNGAENAKYYNTPAGDMLKTDDGIRLRSASYSDYSYTAGFTNMPFDDIRRNWYYTIDAGHFADTVSYTIYANAEAAGEANVLYIVSDLAGELSSDVSAVYNLTNASLYHYDYGDGTWREYIYNYSSYSSSYWRYSYNFATDKIVTTAVIHAENLVFESNFRATISALNNEATYNAGEFTDTKVIYRAVMNDGYFWTPDHHLSDEEFEEKYGIKQFFVDTHYDRFGNIVESQNGRLYGTTIVATTFYDAGYNYLYADNNKVTSYGIFASANLITASDSIWAGSITADTSFTNIIASYKYVQVEGYLNNYYNNDGSIYYSPEDYTYRYIYATDNEIAAYGIKVNGELYLAAMGTLNSDTSKITPESILGSDSNAVDAEINVKANLNEIIAESNYNSTDVHATGSSITAAAIDAKELYIGSVSDQVVLNVESKDNEISTSHVGQTIISKTIYDSINAYGIHAGTATLNHFDGTIRLNYGNTAGYGYGIKVDGKLTSETNFSGIFEIDGFDYDPVTWLNAVYGIYAKNISVAGVIDSDFHNTREYLGMGYAIYSGSDITANAFTGTITGAAIGIEANKALVSNTQNDRFDITGSITAALTGVTQKTEAFDIRISGDITARYAIASGDANSQGGIIQYNDNVEIAYSAVINGMIDLGLGINTLTIDSAATVNGALSSLGGEMNLYFNLGEWQEGHSTVSVGEQTLFDNSIKDSFTFTVNLNDAEIGREYTLFEYAYDATEYWDNNRMIAFAYRGVTTMITLNNQDGNSYYGTTSLVYNGETIDLEARFTGNRYQSTVSVTVTDGNLMVNEDLDIITADSDPMPEADSEAEPDTRPVFKHSYNASKDELTISWSTIDPEQYNLATIANYELEYWLYDKNDDTRGKSIVVKLDGGVNKFVITGVENNTQIDWRIRLLGDSSANSTSNWSEIVSVDVGDAESELNFSARVKQDYDAENKVLNCTWFDFTPANCGISSKVIASVLGYKVKYWINDEEYNTIDLAKDAAGFSITDVQNGDVVRFQIQIIGDTYEAIYSEWSDEITFDTAQAQAQGVVNSAINIKSAFNETTLVSNVIDANPREKTTGVVAAIAELSWKNVASAKTIRNYEIQYCAVKEQITVEAAKEEMGDAFISLDDYIETQLDMPYSKLVTGTQVAISNLQNQTYVYWKIRAIDVDGNMSEWIAGEKFRVWTTDDNAAPVFRVEDMTTSIFDFNFPARQFSKPVTDDPKTEDVNETVPASLYSATIAWNRATDSESDVAFYVIEVSEDNGKSWKRCQFGGSENIKAESMEYHTVCTWQNSALDPEYLYKVKVTVGGTELTLDAEIKVDAKGNKYLVWNSKEDIAGLDVSVIRSKDNGNSWGWDEKQNTLSIRQATEEDPGYTSITFDYSAVITGLSGASYRYRILAEDHFGNRTPIKDSPLGSFDADITSPEFSASDSTYTSVNFTSQGATPEEQLTNPLFLIGDIVFDTATDAESGIRSYILKLSNGNNTTHEITYLVSSPDDIPEEQSYKTRITFSGFTAGRMYSFNGSYFLMLPEKPETLPAVYYTADKDGKITLTLDGNKIDSSYAIYNTEKIEDAKDENTVHFVAGSNNSTLIYTHISNFLENSQQTLVSLTGLVANRSYTFDGNTYQADENGNLSIIVQDNIIGSAITLTNDAGTPLPFMVTHDNAHIQYKINIDDLNLALSNNIKYNIFAVDYIGNQSVQNEAAGIVASLTGDLSHPDLYSPTFKKETANCTVKYEVVDDEDGQSVRMNPTITWLPAEDGVVGEDGSRDLGIRRYELKIREVTPGNTSGWETVQIFEHDPNATEYIWQANDPEKPQNWDYLGIYEYQIVAVDYFGKTDVISGQFGKTDIYGPEGAFSKFNAPDIYTEYHDVIEIIEHKVVDAQGYPVMGEDGKQLVEIEERVISRELLEARVTLSWSDNFTDESGVIYKVTVSNDKNLAPDANTYSFWTTMSDGKKIVFDNSTPGRPVGIFENMKTVYWSVEAYDSQYNRGGLNGATQVFEFKNSEGEFINLNGNITKLAAPSGIRVDTSNMVDGCHTDVIGVYWNVPDTAMGVYKFTISLYDEKGKKVIASGNTEDLSDHLTTDLSGSVYVQGSTLSIRDIKKFFGVNIADGKYKVEVTAFDGSGRSAASEKVDFVLDTTRPGRVNVTEYFSVPDNTGNGTFSNIVLRWESASDISGIQYYVVQYREKSKTGGNPWLTARVDGDRNEFILTGIPTDSSPYEFQIYAVDNFNNVGEQWVEGEAVSPELAFDAYSDSVKTPTKVAFNEKEQIAIKDTVGQGDTSDVFSFTTEGSMAVSLTVGDLAASIGKNKDIKIEIFEGNNTDKAWKSYTVKNSGRLFTELFFDANTKYTFKVTNTKTAENVSSFDILIDGAELPSRNIDDTLELAVRNQQFLQIDADGYGIATDWVATDYWVGFGDTTDIKILQWTEDAVSGKYVFYLSDVALSTKLTVYELLDNGKYKSLGSITAKAGSYASTKEIMLDKNKVYFLQVDSGAANTVGTSYTVEYYQTECISATPSIDDNICDVNQTAEIVPDYEGWVGFGDAVDYSRLEVGKNGGVYNFTISHELGSDEAVTLTVYEWTGRNAKGEYTFKKVKSVSLANTAEAVSTGSLYLSGSNGGTYFVEVSAPGAAKYLNSSYELKTDGYNIVDRITDQTDVDNSKENNNSIRRAETISAGEEKAGWVGIGDSDDFYKFTLAEADNYTLRLTGVNGKNISVTLGYFDAANDYKTTKLISKTGTAGCDTLELSRAFTAEELDGKEFYIQITANGKTANSDYTMEIIRNSEITGFDNSDDTTGDIYSLPTISAENKESDWVGLGDAVDYRGIEVGATGYYDLKISDVSNAVKITVFENGKAVKNISLTAAKNSGILEGMLFNSDNEYFIEVLNSGAAKGQNSSYTLDLVSNNAGELSPGMAEYGEVTPGSKIDCYTLNVDGGEVYTFDLRGVNGKNIKLSIIDPATGKAITSLTPAANSTSAALTYEFTNAGEYLVKLESTSKSESSGYWLEVIDRYDEITEDNNSADGVEVEKLIADGVEIEMLTEGTPVCGWVVGLGDAVDYRRIEVGATGYYDLKISDVSNAVKITVFENGKAVKNISLTAAKNSGILEGMLFNSDNEYFIEVLNSGAAEGQNSSYTLDLVSNNAGELFTDMVEYGKVTPGDKIDCYTLYVADGEVYTFDLRDVNGNNIKLSIIDPATGEAITSLTPAENSTSAALTYKFTKAGEYLVKLESTSQSESSGYTLEVIDSDDEITADNNSADGVEVEMLTDDGVEVEMLTEGTPVYGWVGYGDQTDYIELDISSTGTGIYNLNFSVLDNNAKLSLIDGSTAKVIKNVSATQAKAGMLSGLLLDANNQYFISVTAGSTNGTKDTNYVVSVEQTLESQLDGDDLTAPQEVENVYGYATDGWVGYGDESDFYRFTAAGDATEFGVTLNGFTGELSVVLYKVNGEELAKVQNFTLNAKNYAAFNAMMLEKGEEYMVVVTSPKAAKGNYAEYSISIDSWDFDAIVTDNNYADQATFIDPQQKLNSDGEWVDIGRWTVNGAICKSETAKSHDPIDYYMIEVTEDGCYSLLLDGISGSAITLSIGTIDAKGNFKQLQKVSGKANADSLQLARELTAGTYCIRLESNGKNAASRYELTVNHNNTIYRQETNGVVTNYFDNTDDSYKQLVSRTDVKRHDITAGEETVIHDWVGFGDAVDVFKMRMDEIGTLCFDGVNAETGNAISSKEIALTLYDANGKSVALVFDQANGMYYSKNILLANTDYYLQIKSADAKNNDTEYQIAINKL